MFLFIPGEKCGARPGLNNNPGAMRASKTILLLAGLFTISNGLPSSFQCSRYCKEEKNTFGYEPGKVYKYDYEGDVRSLVNSTGDDAAAVDESGVKFGCSVAFHAISTCEFAMQISRVSMEEHHVKNTVMEKRTRSEKFLELREQLTARPLHFSYHSGKIDTICPDGEEPRAILDIKKAILSVFQNSMQNLEKDTLVYETDVTGTCETLYKVESNKQGTTIIKKTKNLDACTHRMSQYLSWQSVPYATNSQAKSLPLLRSSLTCTQIYNDEDVLSSSVCDEKHVFQPFSNGDSGAITVVKQEMSLKIVYDETKHTLRAPKNVARTSLIYESAAKALCNINVINTLELFKELEEKTSDGVEAEVPKLFSQLVYDFQNLSEEDLMTIFNKLTTKQRKFYIDAISLVTTTSGIEVMKQLYVNDKLSKNLIDSWIITLSFIKNPTLETIIAVQPLMRMNTTKQNTILAVSSIIYRYCKANPSCLESAPIEESIKEIERPLENGCNPSSTSDSISILLSLKGIGNAGVTTSLRLLHRCYTTQDSPFELRLAAIAAHRRMSCVHNFNLDDFKNYFANPKENVEIRIASYLATMQCASYAVFAQVKDVLTKEETNQVGSFVWTHITNLQETSVQWKQGIRKLLENEFLRNKFNTDIRKYSRNYEASAFFDSLGTGASLESNVIFTSESYLPRSAMLNFTLDLFGETINVFEVGARMEGFEELVENFFGPEGYFSDKSIKAFLENARNAHSGTSERIKELGDSFRSQKVLKRDPAGLMYAKIFGNEFTYTHFKSLKELIGDPISTDRAINLLIDLFRKNDVEYQKSFLFLESTYQIPTIIGFPLELVANGTATLGLTVKGKLDIKELWSYKMAIEGKIYPSASFQITGTMSVDSLVAKTGVKYVGSMNSNTFINGHAVIDAGKIVDLKVNVPKKQMDIISASSDVFIIHNDYEYKIQDASNNIEDAETCTHDMFSKMTGLQVCYNLHYVNASQVDIAPYFPLTGSFKYALNIKKTDTFDSYQLHVRTQVEEQIYKPLYLMSLYLDTPNSKIDRRIEASYNLNLEKLSLNAKFQSPFTSFEINSNLGNELNKYSFQLETIYNNKEMVFLQSSFNKKSAGEKLEYDSQAKLNFRERQIAAISGSLNYLHRGQYAANMKLEGITNEPIVIVGDLLHDPNSIKVRTTLSSRSFSGNMETHLHTHPEGLALSSSLNYTLNSENEENLLLTVKLNKIRRAPSMEDTLTIQFQSTKTPIYNLLIDLYSERKPWFYKNYGKVTFFETTWETKQLLKFMKEKHVVDMDMHAFLTCEQKGIDYKAILLYNASKAHLNTHALLQLSYEDRLEVAFNYEDNDSKTLNMLFYYPKQGWSFDGLVQNRDPENYYVYFNGYRSTGQVKKQFLALAGDYTNSSMDFIHDHKLNCTVDLPESNGRWATPWVITASLQKSNDLFLSFCQIKTRNNAYASHMNWMKDTFNFVIQANDKRLMVANAAQNSNQLSVLLALNVYQHFEMSVKLILPFEKFDVRFYWDKDRDEEQKFLFAIERNSYRGLYNMDMEYPNQKIVAAFVLLPTQVTMNVTWGVKLSQRIYLKVGNKIFDIGGIWFGELETPFQYLEKQEFLLKYYIVPKFFEVQSDVSWRYHSIYLLMSGSKSDEHLSGVFRLNTTLPEISKVGADMTYRHENNNNYKTDATFIYNEHQITAQSNWKLEGVRIVSDFSVESPSNTIQPIGGVLSVNTLQHNSLVFEFIWQSKKILVVCKFKSDTSSIVIDTPFKGFEKTTIDYTVKAYADSVSLAVTVDLLNQFNNVDLRWSNLNDSMEFSMNLTSPVTGYYSLQFTHSTVLGILKECFRIKGHAHKDIVLVRMDGHIISILEINIRTFLKLLEHKASLTIENKRDPILSSIAASWNDFNINSTLSFTLDSQQIDRFSWKVASNVLDDTIEVQYYHVDNEYVTCGQISNKFEFENTLFITTNYELVRNKFYLSAPGVIAELNYNHETKVRDFTQTLNTNFLGHTLNYTLNYLNCDRPIISIKLDMPYKLLNSKANRVIFTCDGTQDDLLTNIALTMNRTNETPMRIEIDSDFSKSKAIALIASRGDSQLDVVAKIDISEQSGVLTLKSVTKGTYFNTNLQGSVNMDYALTGAKQELNIEASNKDISYNLEATLLKTYNLNLDITLKKNKAKLAALEVLINKSAGQAVFTVNSSKSRLVYVLQNNKDLELFAMLTSNFEVIPACRLNLTYSGTEGERLISIDAVAGDHEFYANGSYSLDIPSMNNEQVSAKFDSNLCVLYTTQGINKIDVDMKLVSEIQRNTITGTFNLGLNTNIKNFEIMELKAEYLENKGYDVWASYNHNNEAYRVEFNNFVLNDVFEISSKIEGPTFGVMKLEINTLKKYNEYTTQMILNVNDKVYTADVITSYISILDTASRFQITTSDERYSGNIEIKFGNDVIILNLTLALPYQNYNKITFSWETKSHLEAVVQIDYIELVPQKLIADYNMQSDNKLFTIKYYDDAEQKYTLGGEITTDKLNIRLDKGDIKDYIVLGGTHKFNNYKDFSVSYGMFKEGNKIKIDVLNYFGDIYQTKFDLVTHIPGWNRLTLESKIDKDKIRLTFNFRTFRLSMVAKNYSPKGSEILSVNFQGETLLEVWSGAGQMNLRTSSRFGKYRFFVQCTQNPGIYGFSILKDGENLISFMLQNFTNGRHIDFKGKLIAPELIPKYSNLSMQFHADYDISKSLQFHIYNSLNKLFEVKWFTQRSPGEYTGYFKFNSQLNMLQNFEIYPVINLSENIVFNTRVSVSLNSDVDEYFAMMILPKKNSETKLDFRYPCKEYNTCEFLFNLKPTFLDFHWTSPFDSWRNVSLKTDFNFGPSSVMLDFGAKRADEYMAFSLGGTIMEQSAGGNVTVKCKLGDFDTSLFAIAIYDFYKLLDFTCTSKSDSFALKAIVGQESLTKSISVVGKYYRAEIVFSGTAYSDEAFIEVVSNEHRVLKIAKGKLNDKNHTQFLTAILNILVDLNTHIYYDMSDVDHQQIGCYLKSNRTFYLDAANFNASVDFSSNLSYGFMKVDMQGVHRNDTNMIQWFSNFGYPKTILEANITHNAHLTDIKLYNDIEDNAINSSLLISCGGRTMELLINGKMQGTSQLHSAFELRTPLESLREIKMSTALKHVANNYYLFNVLSWPHNHITVKAAANMSNSEKLLEASFDSSFTPAVRSLVEYRKSNEDIDFRFDSSSGEEFVKLDAVFVSGASLKANVDTTFDGYRRMKLTGVFDKSKNSLNITAVKEDMAIDMSGVFVGKNDAYEVDMEVNYPNGVQDIAKAYLKYGKDNFNATFKFSNDAIRMNVDLDNNIYNVYVSSPYECAKEINLKGIYMNDVNIYSFETDGNWNDLIINFVGKLNFINPQLIHLNAAGAVGDSYKAGINFTCDTRSYTKISFDGYFPDENSKALISFDNALEYSLTVKTPFKLFSWFNLKTVLEKYHFRVNVKGNILDTGFTSYNVGRLTATDLSGKFFVHIPKIGSRLNITLEANAETGAVNIKHISSGVSDDITLAYAREYGKLESNFLMNSTRFNVSHKVILIYKDGPNIEYGVIVDDTEVIERISAHDDNFSVELLVNIPYLKIKKSGIHVIKNIRTDLYTISTVYNQYYLKLNMSFKNKLLESQLDFSIPIVGSNYVEFNLEKIENGILAVCNVGVDVRQNSTLTYCNNEENINMTLITTLGHDLELANRIFLNKDLSKILINITGGVLFEMERGTTMKFLIARQSRHRNEMINIQLTEHSFLIRLVTPLIWEGDVGVILNKFTESDYKVIKLFYTEKGAQKYNASITYKNTVSSDYSLKAVLLNENGIQVIDLDAKLTNRDYIDASINLNALGVQHTSNFSLNLNHPYIGKLYIQSPCVKNNKFSLEIEATNLKTITFYVASGDQSLGNYILFQSAFQGKSVNVNIKAPNFSHLKLFELATKWNFETNNTSYNYLKVDSDMLGDMLMQVDFVLLQDLLDIETHLRAPFLENFESFDGKIYIPKEFRPKIEIILTNNRVFSVHFDHKINSSLVYISAGFDCLGNKNKLLLDLSLEKYEIYAEAEFNKLKGFNYFALQSKNRYHMINLNNREYTLKYDYLFQEDHNLFKIKFNTPFESLKESSLHIEYKKGDENLLWLTIHHPGFNTEIKLGLQYQNALSFELVYLLKLPFTVYSYDYIDVAIRNNLNPRTLDNFYSLQCMAATNNNNLTFKLGATDSSSFKQFLVYSELNREILLVHMQLLGNSFNDFKLLVETQTPLKFIQDFKLALNSFTHFVQLKHVNELAIIYNKNLIIDGYFNIEESALVLIAENMWQPFSLHYKYVRNEDLNIFGKLIWDLRKPNETQIGSRLFLGDKILYGLYIPNNTITFEATSSKDDTCEIYHWLASWNENQVAMYSSIKNETTSDYVYLDTNWYFELPFRKFHLKQNANISLGKLPAMNSTMSLIWGNEDTSSLTFKNEILPGKLISRLITKALPNDIVLKVDMSKFNIIPSVITAQLKYSDEPDKLLQFEIYYNKNSNGGFASERNFIFKHPASKIDYELYFSSTRRPNYSNGSVILKYRNFETNAPEAIRASVKVAHDKFGVLGEVETNKNNLNFVAASTSSDDTVGFQISSKINEKDPLHLECEYNYKQVSPSFNFVASYGDSRKYFLYAGLPNEREITAKLGNELYGKYSIDSLLTMKLNTSQLLWVKILWKKELYPQFYKAVFEEYSDLRFVIEATGKELIDVIDDDIGKEFIKDAIDIKYKVLEYASNEKDAIIKDFKDSKLSCANSTNYLCNLLSHPVIIEFGEQVFGPFQEYFALLQESFEKAFNALVASITFSFNIINEQIENALKDIKNINNIKIDAKDILQRGISDARKSLKEMESIAINLLDDFDKYLSFLKLKIEEFFEPFLDLLEDLVVYVEQRLTLLQLAVLDILETVQKYVYNLKETKEMLRVYTSYINWLEELHVTDMLEPIGDVIEDILDTVIADIKKVTEHYKPYLDALSEAIFGKYDGINQLPPITEFREFVNRVYQRTIWIWNYHNMTENLKTFIHKLSNDIDDILSFIEFNEKSDDFETHFGLTDYVVRPEIGLIEISQPLSFHWEAFNKPPSFEQHPLYQKIQKQSEQFIKFYKNRYDLPNSLEHFLLDLSEPTMAPTTYNFAMVIGNSHFSTFNNQHYNFLSNCSYLLASNFQTNSFSLVIKYNKVNDVVTRSFEILTSGASIGISSDFNVLFDDKNTDLPLMYNHLTVTRERETIIVESTKGFKMVCNVHYDFCTIQLSGWLFGKTAGLLGTLDNEKNTDTTLSNGTQTKNIQEFANSWKLQQECASVTIDNNKKLSATPTLLNGLMNNLCNVFFFNKNSPLSACFDNVNPKPFLDICTQDLQNKTGTTVCSSIAAYRSRCKTVNVNIEIPEMCVHCDSDIEIREKVFDGHNPKSIDVVFITQLDCFTKGYNISLPNYLEEVLLLNGYHDNRYASVGYGGKTLSKPHVYTMVNKVWTNSDEVSVKYKYDYARWNALKYRGVEAVKYATSLNFRPGVPKMFILSQCETTAEMENAPQIYNMLGEKDITLHILKPQPFGNFSSETIGMDMNNNVYTRTKVSPTSEEIVNGLEDVYSALALTTNGTIFDSDQTLESVNVASEWARFVARTVRRSPCQKCKCVPDSDGVGRIECTRCLTPAVKQFLNEYESSSKMTFSNSEFMVSD